MRDPRHRRVSPHRDVALFAEVFRRVDEQLARIPYAPFDVVRKPARAVGNRLALFENQDLKTGVDPAGARRGAQAGGHSPDHDEPHQPRFWALTNSRMSKALISRPGKKLFTASSSFVKISKIVASLVAISSSTLRLLRFSSLATPPVERTAVEHITIAPSPVLSM